MTVVTQTSADTYQTCENGTANLDGTSTQEKKNLNEGRVCNHSVTGNYDLQCISTLLATSCHHPPVHHKKCYSCGGYKAYQFCFVVTSADPLRLGRLPRCDTAALPCQDQQWFQLCLLTSVWLHSRGQFLVSTPLRASARPENALHTYADPPPYLF